MKNDDAIKANIYVHSSLVNSGEYQKSPHFLPENQDQVKKILNELVGNQSSKSNKKAIDFGCGTGFMIHLMKDMFDEIHGVDITVDMMNKVDVTSGNIFLHESLAEKTPFEDEHFDFATAYSFMDHLVDYKVFLKEAFRVLKPDGIFYSDLNPNRSFINAIAQVEQEDVLAIRTLVDKEIKGSLHNGKYYEEKFGIDSKLLEQAEPIKSFYRGFDASETVESAMEIGFSDCRVEFEWFLGEAKYIHGDSPASAKIIDEYLNAVLPVSACLYKYLRFVFVK